MDLIERYLRAVEFWLPSQQKQDIVAELSADIHAQIEEQESALGRRLNEAEVEAILKQRDRPVLIANRYLPQEYLIGPALFPIYRFVLKVVLLCSLAPPALVRIGLMVFHPSYRAGHTGGSWTGALESLLSSAWFSAFIAMGTVTVAFAVLERMQAKSRFLETWNPRNLPRLRNLRPIARSASSIELGVNLALLVCWAANMTGPIEFNHPHIQISLAPMWRYFFWGFLLLACANTVLAAVNLMRPYWTALRAGFRLFIDCAGAVLFCRLLQVHILTGLTVENVSPERAIEITTSINLWMEKLFPAAIVLSVVIALSDAYRIVWLKRAGVRLTRQAAVVTLLLLFAAGTGGQTQRAGIQPLLPADAEIRKILVDRIDVHHKSSGIVVGITKPAGRRVVSYGELNKRGQARRNGDTVFEIASVTKV